MSVKYSSAVQAGNERERAILRLYEAWCESAKLQQARKRYWTYVEKAGGREAVYTCLVATVRSHYDRLDRIADDVARLGYEDASEILRTHMPQSLRGRSGDLGEILATEIVEEEVGFRVPVRRLRYKDGRNLAMRGDDFIGIELDIDGDILGLLKGEAKSTQALYGNTVTQAREVLNRDNGRCTPGSLLFVADRLLDSTDSDDNLLGRKLRDEVAHKSIPASRIGHMLFTLSGNGPHQSLKEDLDATGTDRDQYVVNVHVEDHRDFVEALYLAGENLGDA